MISAREHEHNSTERCPGVTWAVIGLMVCWTASAGCADSSDPDPSRETNWLRKCTDDGDCNSAGSCECGVCTERCAGDDACAEGLVCKGAESALVLATCGPTSASGLCAPECESNADCSAQLRCVEGACAPMSASSTGGGDSSGGGPQAFVVGAMVPDAECNYTSGSSTRQIGQYDIARGGESGSTGCRHGYDVVLGITSDEAGVIQLSGATVELMTLQRERLVFDSEEQPLPNPLTFESTTTLIAAAQDQATTGVYRVQVIAPDYAPYLTDFTNQQILAEVQLHGRDGDDQPVALRPFVYPIDICDACLSRCASFLIETMMSREDFAMGQCDDNAGSDERMCWDPEC